MKPLRWITTFCIVFALAVAASATDEPAKDAADIKDKLEGKWQSVKGAFPEKNKLTFKKYPAFKPGTAGDYWFTELQTNLVGPGGKKMPPTDIAVGVGSYSIDGNKLTLDPGALPAPIGKKKVVWEVVKVTDDLLILTTDKGKKAEFKKVR